MAESGVARDILAAVSGAMGQLVMPRANAGLDVADFLRLVDGEVAAGDRRECLHAGIWVLADDLERAHGICQAVETAHGAAWHAVVHRREGDFWNSKYWWRRAQGVKFYGLMEKVRDAVKGVPELEGWMRGAAYDPAGFVDLVERYAGRMDLRSALVAVQRLEWVALFEECWRG